MKRTLKEGLTRVTFLLNGFIFIIGGTDVIQDNKVLFGIFLLSAAILNLSILIKFSKEKIRATLGKLILLVNIIVAFVTAVDYFISGKKYIQYAWLLIAIMSAIVFGMQLKKERIQTGNKHS